MYPKGYCTRCGRFGCLPALYERRLTLCESCLSEQRRVDALLEALTAYAKHRQAETRKPEKEESQ